MESAGLRHRNEQKVDKSGSLSRGATKPDADGNSNVPRYTIDLSLPPRERYQYIARAYKFQIATLPVLFDDVVQSLHPKISADTVRSAAKLFLRRLYDKEHNEELKGIHMVTGIEMYLLVAFNVLLDLFMGCTSGGLCIQCDDGNSKMLHFRTLDWGMDALRKIVVQLDFVQSPGGPTIASSITYIGYVGVLTGVKEGLSVSLNFRPNHDASTRIADFRFYFHHLMVLFGFRPSISSLLRGCLLPNEPTGHNFSLYDLASIETNLPAVKTTAAYLIFSNGKRTVTMEKDYRSAATHSSEDFIVITNHDEAEEIGPRVVGETGRTSNQVLQVTGMIELAEESISRKRCATRLWQKTKRRSSKTRSRCLANGNDTASKKVVDLMNAYPITNEETHYAAVMDPTEGKIIWAKRYLEPAV